MLLHIKWVKKIITLGNVEVEKDNFYQHKIPISIYDVKIDRIAVSNKVLIDIKGFIYFIGYEIDYKKSRPWYNLSNISAYIRNIAGNNYISFVIKDNELLEKYNPIWDKVSNTNKKGFCSKPINDKKYLKVNIKCYAGKISINFRIFRIFSILVKELKGTLIKELKSKKSSLIKKPLHDWEPLFNEKISILLFPQNQL